MLHHGDPFGEIVGLFAGPVRRPWPGRPATAIAKQAVSGPVRITARGLDGDAQADLRVHGGPDMALHQYPADHMASWQMDIPAVRGLFMPGCFGENIAAIGLDEHALCIGDVLGLGDARVQVTQGRQPCWKLDAHIGRDDMAARFRKTGRTGWYYRVLEPGTVTVGNFMYVMDRPAPEWSVHRVTAARFDTGVDREVARVLGDLAPLSAEWRAHFRARVTPG